MSQQNALSDNTEVVGRQMIDDRTSNLFGAASGSGYGHQSCPAGVPVELALLSLLAAFGVAFGVLYTALTQITGRRRKRSVGESPTRSKSASEVDPFFKFADILLFGLEEFEEKVDRIAEGEDEDDDSWISKIYNQFSFFNDDDVENSLDENDMDSLEPPLLDETWGLGVRNTSRGPPVPYLLDCRMVEHGLHCMESEEGLSGYAKKSVFKIIYHSGLTDPWAGLMAVPEARQVKDCMTEHTECISMEILRREAKDTLDPQDPMVGMYSKKTAQENKENKVNKEEVQAEELGSRWTKRRILVNPDFVQGLDQYSGYVPYEEDLDQHEV